MRQYIHFLLVLSLMLSFTTTLLGEETKVLSRTKQIQQVEDQVFELVNQKHVENSSGDLSRNSAIKKHLASIINYNVFAKNTLRSKNRTTKKSHWKTITPEQRTKFTNLFKELIEQAWMKELKAFNKTDKKLNSKERKRLTYKDEKARGKLTMVYTEVKTDDELTEVDFRFYNDKITDFILDDLSVTRRYRKTFNKHIVKEGFDGLIKKMEDKLDELKKGKPLSKQTKNATKTQ